jgi:imidazole glycerol-phosphate synthase subunit HisH
MTVAVIDYGAGNLASLEGALARLAQPFVRIVDAGSIPEGAPLVLPGVGHFAAAKRALQTRGLWQVLQQQGAARGVLGICLGLQLLAEGSEEAPEETGLGLLSGRAVRFQAPLKVPHMGWNELAATRSHSATGPSPAPSSWAYFVHSYALPISAETVQACTYGAQFTAVAARGRVLGMQHHPEKSSVHGLKTLANALNWLRSGRESQS